MINPSTKTPPTTYRTVLFEPVVTTMGLVEFVGCDELVFPVEREDPAPPEDPVPDPDPPPVISLSKLEKKLPDDELDPAF
jgi:hypothetical protein